MSGNRPDEVIQVRRARGLDERCIARPDRPSQTDHGKDIAGHSAVAVRWRNMRMVSRNAMHIARQRSSPIVSINAPCASLLSFPKIISQRNGGAAQIRLGWLQQPRFVALPVVAHPCPAPSACGPHCTQHNKKEFVVGAPRRLPSRHSRRTVPIRRSNIALRRAPHPRLRASDRALLAWMAWLASSIRPDMIFRKDRSLPIGAIIVAHQIGRCRVPWERLQHLLRQAWPME